MNKKAVIFGGTGFIGTYFAKINITMQFFTISLYLITLSLKNSLIILISDIFLFLAIIIILFTGYIYTSKNFEKET